MHIATNSSSNISTKSSNNNAIVAHVVVSGHANNSLSPRND